MPRLALSRLPLLLLFALSGAAALVYEVVWFQLLQLLVGSSALSLAVLLATYMGGMCLGSYLFHRVVGTQRAPLFVYGVIELLIGACGLVLLHAVPALESVFVALASPGSSDAALRAAIAGLCLLPPTALMGATLPAMSRYLGATKDGAAWVGLFYGANIFGAVAGTVMGGFWLLRLYDLRVGSYAAVALNVVVGAASLLLARSSPAPAAPKEPAARSTSRSLYWAIGLSGFCALGAEVVWTRLLSLLLGATVYTFSIILAVFLAGLGVGGAAGAWAGRRFDARRAFGLCQLLLAAATAWAAYAITTVIPEADFAPTMLTSPLELFGFDAARCLWALFPAAMLWGASFPLVVAALAGPGQEPSKLVGRLYAANTLGGIAGALGFSVLAIPQLGTHSSLRLLVLGSAGCAALVLWGQVKRWQLGLALTAAAVLAAVVPEMPFLAIAYGRRLGAFKHSAVTPLFVGEGMSSTAAVSQDPNGVRFFHVSGKVEASTLVEDMRLQRMLGHLASAIHGGPKSVLVVGFGAGVTAGTFVVQPGLERLDICELEPIIPPATGRFFAHENHAVLSDPRTHVTYDDARHFVLTSRDHYDLITSDPIHPWVKGTSTLYSKEYFERVKRRLNPGGVVSQWIPLYESDPATVKSELKTFFSVFPHGTLWTSGATGRGYDLVAIGELEPKPIHVDELLTRLESGEYAGVRQSMGEARFGSLGALLATYVARSDDLTDWLEDAQENEDLNMRLQYLAGWSVNVNAADSIFLDISKRRVFPDDLFLGPPELISSLHQVIDSTVR